MEGIMAAAATARVESKLEKSPSKAGMLVFGVILLSGILYAGINLLSDLSGVRTASTFTYLLLAVALLTALGFEFVNGFHDTANAVATVIYTHSLEPHVAVVWSGFWNFLGVVLCTGAVAFGIISLLPVELILQVGRGAGFAMVFALLVAAIIWNLGTWYFGLPSSSSHTLIGSIIGVGIANQLMAVKTGTSGVDWAQATNIGKTLLISPVAGFVCAGLLLLLTKAVIPDKRLYRAPVGEAPPPLWIRALLVLTCTGVSFAHGSNDGQKGMGLIMLILIGTVPTAYALNHAVTARQSQEFVMVSNRAPGFVTTVHQLQRDSDRKSDARIRAVAKVVPVVIIDVNVIVSVPVFCPGPRPGIHEQEPKAAVREARIPQVDRGLAVHPEPVLTPETEIVGVLRNVVTAIASALRPGAMIAVPIAIATLLPCTVPLPAAALF